MDSGALVAITGFITAMGAVVVSILTSRSAAHKSDVELLAMTLKMLQDENKRLAQRVTDLEAERKTNRERIDTLEAQVCDLEEQVRKLGAIPVTEAKKHD
jgi:predicted nuclease with TOPRIM domain